MTFSARLGGWLVVVWIIATPVGQAQGTLEDFERMKKLTELARNKVFRDRIEPHWLAKNERFWYRLDLEEGKREYIVVDAIKARREPAFDHAIVAKELSKLTGKTIQADRLPIDQIDFDEQGKLLVQALGKRWEVDLGQNTWREVEKLKESKSTLPTQPGLTRSRRTGDTSSISFVNRTTKNVQLFWLDQEGEAVPYAKLKPDQEHDQHTFAGHVWQAKDDMGRVLGTFEATALRTSAIIENLVQGKKNAQPSKQSRRSSGDSPDGTWHAFLKESNVYLRNRSTLEEIKLSDQGTLADAFEGPLVWSPDSRKLLAVRTKRAEERKAYVVESSPKGQVVPKLHSFDYRRPGDPIPQSKPHLFDIASRKEIAVSEELIPNPWSLGQFHWQPDSSSVLFLYNQRGHQVLRVISIDSASGKTKAIVDEHSKTFIDYDGKLYLHYLDKTGELIWMSERDGWNHLYLYDTKTGELKNQITQGDWLVRGVDRIDEEKREIWFNAGGIHAGQDPYHIHYARVKFDGSDLVMLTEGDGLHTITYSPDQIYLIDQYSRVDLPPITELRRVDNGKLVIVLEKADASALLKAGVRLPERFVAKGRDRTTDIHGVIFRPSNFDPGKSYAVIEDIYAGPQGSFVPRKFQALHHPQLLAELGFIVVKIDGMGTSHRSRAFHDVCWKNLGDAGLPDRILWIKAAARKDPSMDLKRVGIYGTSAGGQSSLRAMLAYPDFYRVCVSICGCHINLVDKIWWNELWMGWPIGVHYTEQSNVTQAHRLEGKLLLVVGELDKNVDPASTFQVANALIKANKDFDLLVIPGGGHGIGGAYGERRLQDFFVRHLYSVEPRRR